MEKVNSDLHGKPPLQESFLRLSEKITEEGAHMPSADDKEWFIRKSFETDPKKGCELLFKCYYNPLCSHAARFVYSRQIAEDLVGEVFYVFWQKQLHTQIYTSFRAYLFTAVRHRALTYLRCELSRKNSSYDSSDLEKLSSLPAPDQMLQYDELYFTIEKAIQSLPPQGQKVFIMSRFESKKNQAIADELKLSLKTVEAHLTKALHNLRKAIKGDWLILLCLIKLL